MATYEEIEENNFNLNISRYVDPIISEEEISLKSVAEDLKANRREIVQTQIELVDMLKDLRSDDSKIMDGLQEIIRYFEGEDDEE